MQTLPKHYDHRETEAKWRAYWRETGLYRFDPDHAGPIYSVDTPPPTVSGALHIGHIFSYTQAEAVVRYRRMRGHSIFYPFGFDDNGLPTERLVEKEHRVKGSAMPRGEFVDLCLRTTKKYEEEFKELWQRLGFSADWDRLDYATISPVVQRISQRSFLDLHRKGVVYNRDCPTLWCCECETSIAQAELEEAELASTFSDLRFRLDDGRDLIIATTRPELLPACVAVFVHPDDARHRPLVGRTARVPLFDQEVPILTDPRVDPEKGTGIVMCCTFGDATDVVWWQAHRLPLRTAIDSSGRMNERAGPHAGRKVPAARAAILEELRAAGLVLEERKITHPVNTHERCGTPVEFLSVPQWFIRILDHKADLIEMGKRIRWYPPHMLSRYVNWVEGIEWDWNISRQRFFGVPFPLWRCEACGEVRVARDDELPVDPLATTPADACPCGARAWQGEKDVMDTWATSSVTPQINARWGEADDRSARILPMDLRPQAHDIIRTWAFYTIVKSYFHHGDIPWRDVVISGHVQAGRGEKISKSKGSKQRIPSPMEILAKEPADGLRYWACSAKLGNDYIYNPGDFNDARRLLTKLWNAARFSFSHLEAFQPRPIEPRSLRIIDQWLLARVARAAGAITRYWDGYEFGIAKGETEGLFWHVLCDNYLELVKDRLYNEDKHGADARRSALTGLYAGLYAILRLFAPILPFITEELYQAFFREREPGSSPSIHVAPWPVDAYDVDPEAEPCGDLAVRVLSDLRGYKTTHGLSMNKPLSLLAIALPPELAPRFFRIADDLRMTANLAEIRASEEAGLADYRVDAIEHEPVA
ncbi:MAG: valine--tRNA ligase [Planctomycetes bacterium]|nr:valine--tRNA ligase [Planctomycetota bacterium]